MHRAYYLCACIFSLDGLAAMECYAWICSRRRDVAYCFVAGCPARDQKLSWRLDSGIRPPDPGQRAHRSVARRSYILTKIHVPASPDTRRCAT